MSFPHVGIDILAEIDVFDLALSFQDDEFQVTERVRFERLDPESPFRHLVAHDIYAAQPFEIHIVFSQDFVEREQKSAFLPARYCRAQKTRKIRSEIQDMISVRS